MNGSRPVTDMSHGALSYGPAHGGGGSAWRMTSAALVSSRSVAVAHGRPCCETSTRTVVNVLAVDDFRRVAAMAQALAKPASEIRREATRAETLTAAIKLFGHKDVRYVGALENAAAALRDHVQPGDLVLTLGAGTVKVR